VDHPTPVAMPQRPHPRPGRGAGRSSSLPRARRRTHHLDMPTMRCHGVRAAAQHPMHDARRAGAGADLELWCQFEARPARSGRV